jgi:hypothetical protein
MAIHNLIDLRRAGRQKETSQIACGPGRRTMAERAHGRSATRPIICALPILPGRSNFHRGRKAGLLDSPGKMGEQMRRHLRTFRDMEEAFATRHRCGDGT